MEVVICIIPFLVVFFLLFFFKKEVVWWEYVILLVPSLLIFLITRLIMVSVNQTDEEYLGGYITKVRHYDEWDEWVERTCSKEVAAGTDSDGNTIYETVYYDCSYRDYHPERWTYFDNNGEEHWLYYKEEFDKIRKQFGTRMIFVDMHRDYYHIDGDAQDYLWNGTKNTIYTVTYPHSYTNKVQCSRSTFNFMTIEKEEADSLGLYNYPKIEDYDQNPVLSPYPLLKSDTDAIRFINGYYGKKYQFRLYVLIFQNKDIEISELQRSYWQGGNKNELVTCIGVDDNLKVKWCNAFSWCDAPTLEVRTESFFAENPVLDLQKYSELIETCLEKGEWQRKEFEDFQYISVDLTPTQELIMLILIAIYNIGMSIFVVMNKVNNVGDF